jgi:hypothetical protein
MSVRGPERRRGAVPAAPNALVGRAADLAGLVRVLTEPATRLVTLTGPPGVGKTRLAVAAAAAVAERFRDGVVFADPPAVRDASLVPFELAAVLGLDATGEPSGALARMLRPKHLLVVLDNFEHVLDAAPALSGPLGACPRLRLLVTSRERLHLQAEREVPVQPLALPMTPVGARNSAHLTRPADIRGSVHRPGRVVGRCGSRLLCGGGVVVGERPGAACGAADGRCNGVRTGPARPWHGAG